MKLRNKTTGTEGEGHIVFTEDGIEISYQVYSDKNGHCGLTCKCCTLEDLANNFEIVKDKPTEPLIKDEKVRKAVRAWADANDCSIVKVGYDMASEPHDGYVQVHFEGAVIVDEDKYGVYTIAELCGEEEE